MSTLVPGEWSPGTGALTEQPGLFDPPGGDDRYWPWAAPATVDTQAPTVDNGGAGPELTPTCQPARPVHGLSETVVAQIVDRASSPDFHEWMGHIKGAAGCKHPIRLEGSIVHRLRDGSVMAAFDTADMPDGVVYVPCGNRRATVCPSCAATYRRDTFHLVRAGLRGERWGLPPLGEHIALFVTVTAPSFGPVHHRVVKTHAADCRKREGCVCRAEVCQPFGRPCRHGMPMVCRERHTATDRRLGAPLCMACYDYPGHVVWHHEAPELWRRTVQQIDREIRRLGHAHGVELRRRYVKVYEFQVRGAIHYHALIRLDGHDPTDPETVVPAPASITREMFADAVRAAFVKTSHTSAPHPANRDRGWRIGWGAKGLDIKHVNAASGDLDMNQVSGYLAKYVTKGTEDTGLELRRVDDLVLMTVDSTTHLGRLVHTCWRLGEHPDWTRLRRYAHQYGYGGHITTKSRRWSVTMRFIRRQRMIWRRTAGHPEFWDDDEAALVVAELGYHATGWITTGDAVLANTSAALARSWRENAYYADPEPSTTGYPRAA